MGFCTHFLRKGACAVALVSAAACGPAEPLAFDADAAAADAGALHAAFDAPLLRSMDFAAPEIDLRTGGSEPFANRAATTVETWPRSIARIRRQGETRISASSGELPAGMAGRTFAFDAAGGAYVLTPAPGAPPSGVRFRLYAIDAESGGPALPLAEIGHVDVIWEGDRRVQILAVSHEGFRLEYRVSSSGSAESGLVRVEGYVLNDATHAVFDLATRTEVTGSATGRLRLDHRLSLPARSVELECGSDLLVEGSASPELALDLALHSPNAAVRVAGSYALGGGGSLEVAVNGSAYAAVQVNGASYVMSGAGGDPLPEDGAAMLAHVIGARDAGLEIFDRLARPVELLTAP